MCSLFTSIGNLCLLRYIVQRFSYNFGNTIFNPTQKGKVHSVVLRRDLKQRDKINKIIWKKNSVKSLKALINIQI